jgi:hypothetical protein
MKKKTFLVFILFLTWLNYLLSYEYVKIMMDTADASKVSNTIVLLIFPNVELWSSYYKNY